MEIYEVLDNKVKEILSAESYKDIFPAFEDEIKVTKEDTAESFQNYRREYLERTNLSSAEKYLYALFRLGELKKEAKETEAAKEIYEEILDFCDLYVNHESDFYYLHVSYRNLGDVALASGDVKRADRCYSKTEELKELSFEEKLRAAVIEASKSLCEKALKAL